MQIQSPKTALFLLAALHLLAGTLLCRSYTTSGKPTPLMAMYSGLMFSQIGLLGIWTGLRTSHWAARLLGVGLGMAYLARQFLGLPRTDHSALLLFMIISIVAVASVLLVVRKWIARVQLGNGEVLAARARGVQFSIRHLLLLTLATGCLLALGRWIRTYFPNSDDLFFAALFSLCCLTITLPSVWSMLGTPHPFLRSTLVCGVAVGAGTLLAAVFSLRDNWFHLCSIMVLDWLFLHASLLVVRLCGYRLVRLRRPGTAATSAASQTPSSAVQPCSPDTVPH